MENIPNCYQKKLSNPIIVALDKAGKDGAIEIIKELGREVWGYKLGALLFRHGISLLDDIQKEIGSVNLFIDLEFAGNPDFIAEVITACSLYSANISYIVVNAAAGPPGIKAAVDNARISKILVGSVIDSLTIYDIKYIYGTDFPEEKTLQFAKMAKAESANGIYCSSRDLETLSHYPELENLTKIVYGVRPKWDLNHGSHKYVMTPKEVMKRGATKFVIGSTIRDAKGRVKAVRKILKEIK
ncbi:MAG: orotidine 5'-phosphate decarboxylase [Candidatus Nealsonbacteria bacterium]|nr:orotidine 5'-phosphate decarboxylase [Candidatus Nealsonbacteria bacterium]